MSNRMKPENNKNISTSHRRLLAILPMAAAVSLSLLLPSCRRTPEGVLNQDEMASLMADIHIGEAVVDYNYSQFPNDSTRKLLRQSIYAAHGVTDAQVDTSFAWYGNHIEDYLKVYEKTIELIKQKQSDLASAASSQIAISGDSVAVWNGPSHLTFNDRTPGRIITFQLTPDSTWNKDDVYMLRYKPLMNSDAVKSRILVDYSNGRTTYVDETLGRGLATTQRIELDSTLTPVRLYGYITVRGGAGSIEIDSLALIRMRRYMLNNAYVFSRRFDYGTDVNKPLIDSVSATVDSIADFPALRPTGFEESSRPARSMSAPREVPASAQMDHRPGTSASRGSSEHRRNAATQSGQNEGQNSGRRTLRGFVNNSTRRGAKPPKSSNPGK